MASDENSQAPARPLAGRIALVSGGSRGIGRGIALGLAEDGADVAINYTRDASAAKETADACQAFGVRAAAYRASVEDYAQDEAMVEAIVAELGPPDLLVNNAGIASRGKSVQKTDPDELARVVGVHAFGAHYLSKLVIPHMREKGGGDIIMISSSAARDLNPGGAPYNMGKVALEALATTLAKEVRRYGIRVNIVAPGLVETEMGRRLVKAARGVDDIAEMAEHMPFGRGCQPEDIANAVRFFVSDRASYITGEKLTVHGGGNF